MNTHNIKIFLITLLGLSLFSCSDKEENPCDDNNDSLYTEFIQQKVRLVNEDGEWIDGIKDANVELIATDEEGNPLLDKGGKVIKQIPRRIEAVKSGISAERDLSWISLYMSDAGTFANVEIDKRGQPSYFKLVVGDRSFRIKANYMPSFCRKNILKYLSFEGGLYPAGSVPVINLIVPSPKAEN